MPATAIVLVGLAMAVVVGLIAGAVWGQTGSRGGVTSASESPTTSGTPSTSTPSTAQTDTSSATPEVSGSPTSSQTSEPVAPPTGAAPSAPATTTTSADGWRLGSWKITTTGGTLGVDTTVRNTATGPRSATLVLYVYVGTALIATTTTVVTDVPAGATVPVQFSGTDPWAAGTKVLLLATA